MPLPLSLTDKAYIAGLMDGEGCITISRTAPTGKRGEISARFNPVVSIANTDLPVLQWIQRHFGGHLHLLTTWNKPCYSLSWGTRNAARFLDIIYPFLQIKKQQADVVRSFYVYRDSIRHHGNRPRPQTENDALAGFRTDIHRLNHSVGVTSSSVDDWRGDCVDSYVAGLLDGEGTITITKRQPYVRLKERNPRFWGLISIANTNLLVLRLIQSRYGGKVYRKHGGCHHPVYAVEWKERTALSLLRILSPFIRIKRPQAQELQEFYEYRDALKRPSRKGIKGGSFARLPTETARFEEFRSRIRAMNGRIQ